MGKSINVALVCSISQETEQVTKNKIINALEMYVHVPKSCGLEVKTFCYSEITSQLITDLTEFDSDLVICYGLGFGNIWPAHTHDVTLGNRTIPLISNNHSLQELIYGDKYIAKVLFPIIKDEVEKINLVKSRPSKLKIAVTEEDLIYIRNRCFSEPFGFDTETNFLNPFIKDPAPQMLCYSIAWLTDDEEGWCIPTNEALMTSGNCTYTRQTVLKYTEEIFFESPQPSFIHNAAYDLLVLHELFDGKQPKNFTADTMVLLYLYHHAGKSAALKENTKLVGLPSYKDPIKDWIEAKTKEKGLPKKSLGFQDVPLDIIAPYAAMDALAVTRLINFLKKSLAKSLWKFYFTVPHKVILCSNELACEGYKISRDRFNYTKFTLETSIREAYDLAINLVKDHVDDSFNIGSNQQLATLLFDKDKLNLPCFNKTDKGAPSTGQKTLDDLMLFHPFIFRLAKLKKLQKLYSTYSYRGYSGVLNEGSRKYTSKVHWTINAQYKQTNRTARLASSNFHNHHGIKGTGGNVLTLPAKGSMVKHYFGPNIVEEAENLLYQEIVSALSDEDKLKLSAAESFDVAAEIKPAKPKKAPKEPKPEALDKLPRKPRKKKTDELPTSDIP